MLGKIPDLHFSALHDPSTFFDRHVRMEFYLIYRWSYSGRHQNAFCLSNVEI